MHRLQISLTAAQYEFLKSEAFVSNQSMASVLRKILDEVMADRQQESLVQDPIWHVIGVATEVDGPTDISERVDQYLYGTVEAPIPGTVAETRHEYHPD